MMEVKKITTTERKSQKTKFLIPVVLVGSRSGRSSRSGSTRSSLIPSGAGFVRHLIPPVVLVISEATSVTGPQIEGDEVNLILQRRQLVLSSLGERLYRTDIKLRIIKSKMSTYRGDQSIPQTDESESRDLQSKDHRRTDGWPSRLAKEKKKSLAFKEIREGTYCTGRPCYSSSF
jgi:hypothetical protein